jgi:hypothetical protein
MTEFTICNNLVKIYTNKNSSIFSQAGNLAFDYITSRIGLIYDDFDYKGHLKELWGKYKLDKVFMNAPRRLTISMDDKIMFHKKMKDSYYTPESYLTYHDIIDKSAMYFVKKSGSTGGKGVNIYNYEDLLKVDTNNCVIQKNIPNPDLYQNKRYKIRQLVLLYKKQVYIHKNSFFTASNIDYDNIPSDKLRDAHVINQKHDTIFELSNSLENFDLIFKNMALAVKDFTKYYQDKINNISGNIYGVLGFDFIVDSEKNVQIIEINHRSNYAHPKNVSLECDVGFFRDMVLLLVNNEMNNLILV